MSHQVGSSAPGVATDQRGCRVPFAMLLQELRMTLGGIPDRLHVSPAIPTDMNGRTAIEEAVH